MAYRGTQIKKLFRQAAYGLISLSILGAWLPKALAEKTSDTLIIYYSRTGKSQIISKVLQDQLRADILELRETEDRSGAGGFIGAALDSYYDRYSTIEPSQPDLASYAHIILVTPIWNWKLSVPIRTLLATSRLDNKELIVLTTANIDIKKYAPYGDDAPFIKRFLRDYLNGKRTEMMSLAASSGATIVGHQHIATKGITDQQIQIAAEQAVAYIRQKFFCSETSIH